MAKDNLLEKAYAIIFVSGIIILIILLYASVYIPMMKTSQANLAPSKTGSSTQSQP
jgi:hypothetical protein